MPKKIILLLAIFGLLAFARSHSLSLAEPPSSVNSLENAAASVADSKKSAPGQLFLSSLLPAIADGQALKVKVAEARGIILQLDKETLAEKSKLPAVKGVFEPIHLGLAKPAKSGEYGGGMSPRLEFIEKNLAKSLQDLAKLPSACDASHQAQWKAGSASLQLLLKTITQAKQAMVQATWTAKESDKLIQAALPRLSGANDKASVRELESCNKKLQEGLGAAVKALGKGLAGKGLDKKAMPNLGAGCGSVAAIKLPTQKEASEQLAGAGVRSGASKAGAEIASSKPDLAAKASSCAPGEIQRPDGSCASGSRVCTNGRRAYEYPNYCCPEDAGIWPSCSGPTLCRCSCGKMRTPPCNPTTCAKVCPPTCAGMPFDPNEQCCTSNGKLVDFGIPLSGGKCGCPKGLSLNTGSLGEMYCFCTVENMVMDMVKKTCSCDKGQALSADGKSCLCPDGSKADDNGECKKKCPIEGQKPNSAGVCACPSGQTEARVSWWGLGPKVCAPTCGGKAYDSKKDCCAAEKLKKGQMADAKGVCSPRCGSKPYGPGDPAVVAQAVKAALDSLGQNSSNAEITPLNENFAHVGNPFAIDTSTWTPVMSSHGTAMETPLANSSFALKYYDDPQLGHLLAVVYPTKSPGHWAGFLPYAIGLPVNTWNAERYLAEQQCLKKK